ncbi:cyclic nucleotide-binding domain-containing protein [Microbulbifer yueqingensis]|uniref:Cyclic nucleotide-binding domain-containing protein n=1 Tax=Microbulbifer yueqingensis TaxID=658219 RepID=A0A1G8ZT03_9GAMM|nr:cyclic nucleotide-binding domain-containing protein [Microbulbifer yueqingensis]SDK18259.1 Cyclic nucleotide-binding domain-containing protein [Microbulbifer yueqingensis]
MEDIEELLRQHTFFRDIADAHLRTIGGCGVEVQYRPGEYIARENMPADYFFLIRRGCVAVEIQLPNSGPLCLQTLHEGDIFGWSWLFPPYQWTFDARAVDSVQAIQLDGRCLRGKCEAEPELGYELMKRFARIMTERLQATRLQLLDIYGERPGPAEGSS